MEKISSKHASKTKDRNTPFERSIFPFTLFFRDEEYEEEFQKDIRGGKYFNPCYRYFAYLILGSCLIYRIVCVISELSTHFITTSGLIPETVMLISLATSLLIEGLIKWLDKWTMLQGFFFMSAYKVTVFAAAFHTRLEPVFGMLSTMGFVLTFPISVMIFNTWISIAASSILATIYAITDYTHLFSDKMGVGPMVVDLFLLTLATNYPSILFYTLEKRHRRLFFLERETKKNKQRWKSILDCLPVGIILATHNNNPNFINKEAIEYLEGPATPPEMLSSRNRELLESPLSLSPITTKRTARNEIKNEGQTLGESADALKMITDILGNTLRSAIEKTADENDANPVYSMRHKKTDKVYEVTTKLAHNCKIAVVKDQTAHEQLIKEQVLQKYLRMLLSSISHEVRNPLNLIAGCISIILESESIETIKNSIIKLQYAAFHIDYIVNGACYLVMAEDCAISIQSEEFNLPSAIQEVIDMMSCSVNKEKVNIMYKAVGTVPETIHSDQAKYRLIIFHLFTNAAKYTQKGSITIEISYDPGTSLLSTHIKDTGFGMTEEKMSTLFQLYSNINSANEYNPQGMGLGLALCKRLAKALGGDIKVTSKPQEGSVFTFTVRNLNNAAPVKQAPQQHRMPKIRSSCDELIKFKISTPRSEAGLCEHTNSRMTLEECKCTKVLIVDDEASNRLVIRSYLNSLCISADEAENGLVAIEEVARRGANHCCKKYQLIFMDINMPIMDGTTATQKLMAMFEKNEEIRAPIMTVTAANMYSEAEINALLSVGFVDIVQKPVSKKDFINKIRPYFPNNHHSII